MACWFRNSLFFACVFLCFLNYGTVSLFVIGLVMLCFVYYLVVSTSAIDCHERPDPELTCYVSSETVYSTLLAHCSRRFVLSSCML